MPSRVKHFVVIIYLGLFFQVNQLNACQDEIEWLREELIEMSEAELDEALSKIDPHQARRIAGDLSGLLSNRSSTVQWRILRVLEKTTASDSQAESEVVTGVSPFLDHADVSFRAIAINIMVNVEIGFQNSLEGNQAATTRIWRIGVDRAISGSQSFLRLGHRPLFASAKRVSVVYQGSLHDRPSINNTDDAKRLFKNYWKLHPTNDQEQFVVACLDTKHRVQCVVRVTVGTLDASLVHPRKVFKPAFIEGSTAIPLFNHHPSGNPEPSGEDILFTERLSDAGKLLGITVLDHIMFGDERGSSGRYGKFD